jgi:hypothetical protein
MPQQELFPHKDGYSWKTSYPSYKDNQSEKQRQANLILNHIKEGADCLLKLAELTGLPQSTVAGRTNDLIDEGKVMYEGFVNYNNRKRKKIILKQL